MQVFVPIKVNCRLYIYTRLKKKKNCIFLISDAVVEIKWPFTGIFRFVSVWYDILTIAWTIKDHCLVYTNHTSSSYISLFNWWLYWWLNWWKFAVCVHSFSKRACCVVLYSILWITRHKICPEETTEKTEGKTPAFEILQTAPEIKFTLFEVKWEQHSTKHAFPCLSSPVNQPLPKLPHLVNLLWSSLFIVITPPWVLLGLSWAVKW